MIISHEKKFISIHVPKTAGTSIEINLCSALGIHVVKSRKSELGVKWNHLMASDIRFLVGDEMWKDYFIFGFVRNPYDRLLSLYHYNLQLRDEKPSDDSPLFMEMMKYSSFKEFVLFSPPDFKRFRQYRYLADDGGIIVDFIGRYESLESDYNDICKQIGIEVEALPHELKTDHKDWREVYTPKMKKIVYAENKIDFDTFGYDR